MFNSIQKIFSYIYPISIFKTYSEINGWIEVIMYQNKLMIDTVHTNYSYGSLQKILKFGLNRIEKEKIESFKSILILGVAGGSVIDTLINDFQLKAKITGIEIDPEIIEIANNFFKLNTYENVTIINENAEDYLNINRKKFDFIIVDLFVDKDMPDFIFTYAFIKKMKESLSKNGMLLFNTMLTKEDKNKINEFLDHFDSSYYQCNVFKNVEKNNDLILIEKLKIK